MTTAAELLLLIKGDAKGAEGALKSLGDSVGGAGKSLTKLGAPAMVAAGGVAAIGAAGLSMASQMAQGQQNLQASLGVSAEMARSLGSVATDVFANAFGGSVEEVTASVGELSKAFGFDIGTDQLQAVTEQLYTIQDAFDFPIEEQTRALGIMTASFGELAVEPQRFGDMMTRVLQTSGANADDLMETIGEYSPLMAQMGMDADQFFGVLSQGLQAGARDTDFVADLFKEFGIRIVDGSDATKGALESLGLEGLGEKVQSGMVTGAEAFALVQAELAKLPPDLRAAEGGVALMGTKFEDLGPDVVSALNPIKATLGEVEGRAIAAGSNMYNNLGTSVEGIKRTFMTGLGEALLPFQEQLRDKLPGIMSELLPKVSELASQVGSMLASIDVQALADTFTSSVLPAVSSVMGFLSEHKGTVVVIGTAFGALSAAAAILGPILMGVGPIISGIGAVFGFLVPVIGAVVGFLGGPLTIAILAIVGLFLLWKLKGDEIKAALSGAFEGIKTAVSGAVDGIKAAIGSVKDWIVSHKDMIVNALLLLTGPIGALAVLWREKGDEIKAALQDLADRVRGWVDDVRQRFEDVRASIEEKVEAARAFLVETWTSILDSITATIESIRVGVSEGWTRIKEFLQSTLESILEGVRTAWESVLGAIKSALDRVQGVVDTVLSWLETTFGLRMDSIRAVVDTAFEFVRSTIDTVLGLVRGIIDGFMLFLRGDFEGGIRTIIDSVVGFFQGMRDTVGTALSRLREIVEERIRAVIAVFQPIIDKIQELTGIDLYQVGADLINGLQEGIRSAFGAVESALGWLTDHLPGWVKRALGMESPSKVFRDIGQNVLLGFELGLRDGFRDAQQVAVAGIEEIITSVSQAVWGQRLARDAGRAVAAGSARGLFQQFRHQWGAGPTIPTYGAGQLLPPGAQAPEVWSEELKTKGQALGQMVGVSLLEYIRTAPFGAIWGNSLAEWMRARGYDEETIAGYKDLHKMRGQYGWLTREAAALHRRRTILVGGDWTGATGEVPDAGLTPGPIVPRRYEGDLPKRPSGASNDPVSVNLANGRIEGDMTVREAPVFQIVLNQRVIDAIAVEVTRRLAGSLIVKPSPGVP